MGLYSVLGTFAALTTTYKTPALVNASAAIQLTRGRVMELIMGATGAPNATDCPIQWDMSRLTVVGTSTAFTAVPGDPAMSAARTIGGITATVEPTYTANSSVFNIGLNQRNSANWKAMSEEDAPVWPATASNGFGLRALSPTYAAAVGGQINFKE